MSAAEFSQALKNKALAAWFSNEKSGGNAVTAESKDAYALSNINVLTNPVLTYRAQEQSSENTAFVITKDTVRDLIVQFQGLDKNSAELNQLTEIYFNSFKSKNVGVKVPRKVIKVADGLPGVLFPNIGFDSITNLINSVMNIPAGKLQEYYEKGHIVGLTTKLLKDTSNRMASVNTRGSKGKEFLLDQLDKVISYYRRLDLDSANLRSASDIKLYAKYTKSVSSSKGAKYLVELQTKEANQTSAREVQSTIGSVRKLFGSGELTEKAIVSLIEELKGKVSDPKFAEDLISMQSSPSLKSLILGMLSDVLLGKKDSSKQYSASDVLVGTKKLPKVDTSKLRTAAKKKIVEATKVKSKLNTKAAKAAQLRDLTGRFTSLRVLLDSLNSTLEETIKKNMGNGSSKNILNYRTGRFASSARVERLTQSREGMITAFYTYMKNPYATFSQGGRQEVPRTRDPKLLISKSIREIAQERVANRLRAVLV